MIRRILQLVLGLPLYGAGCAFVVAAGLGVDPWTALAEGIALRSGWGVGWVTNIIGLGVLALWIPLRQRPGVGTLANILLVGTAMQLVLDVLPPIDGLLARILLLCGGVLTVAVASGLYIGASFGSGPRDGLMTGLRDRLGWPLWAARGSVEITVLVIGWALGGTLGIGTVVFALAIGPLVHVFLPLLAVDTARAGRARAAAVSAVGSAANRRRAAGARAAHSSRSASSGSAPDSHPLRPS
ncbi:hypothetical protein AB0N73_01475 [Microbacterium sp. NPDC089189]|uniref:membrane protein YczE n=1 Tax=Microbacterium sp. NPDC089189 TaxID=3154972 RepID=UPI00342754E9